MVVPPRTVLLEGRSVSISATAQLFYNFRAADRDPQPAPLLVLFNGFAADVVRAFGTGPSTVDSRGAVVPNPFSLTQYANLLYLEPRQSGFSYDVSVAPTAADCSSDVFNEYVDAADVLLGVLRFLGAHPTLRGPVYFLGESYAGVRIQWLLAYARGAWELAPYVDNTLRAELQAFSRRRDLSTGQILLEPWLVGAAQTTSIAAACLEPGLLAAVQASVVQACESADACKCARQSGRSPYNYTSSAAAQDERIFEADAAQVDPNFAEAIYGVRFEAVAGLRGANRGLGFKCSTADAATPNEGELSALLGALPNGQNYNLAYSPLTPGKGTGSKPDWLAKDRVGAAFLDNLQFVDTWLSDGRRDLVVPERALVPALRALAGAPQITETDAAIRFDFVSGVRAIEVRRYPDAGHMITMSAPERFASDVAGWLSRPRTR